MRRCRWAPLVLTLTLLPGRALSARQASPPPGDTLPSQASLRPALALAVAGVALLPLDRTLRGEARSESAQESGFLDAVSRTVEPLGTAVPLAASTGVALAAHFAGSPVLEHGARHVTESILLASAVTMVVKGLSGRNRPYVDRAGNWTFSPGTGFGRGRDRQSFPSGHATAAFALARSLTLELRRHAGSGTRWFEGVVWTSATLTALSRVYDDQHWASDVVVGAAVGWASGTLVDRIHHRRGRRAAAMDGLLLAPSPSGSLVVGFRLSSGGFHPPSP